MSNNKKGSIPPQDQASINKSNTAETKYIADITNTPFVDGQCAEVLSILRKGPVLSFVLTADYAIPEAAARVHDLRARVLTSLRIFNPKWYFVVGSGSVQLSILSVILNGHARAFFLKITIYRQQHRD